MEMKNRFKMEACVVLLTYSKELQQEYEVLLATNLTLLKGQKSRLFNLALIAIVAKAWKNYWPTILPL